MTETYGISENDLEKFYAERNKLLDDTTGIYELSLPERELLRRVLFEPKLGEKENVAEPAPDRAVQEILSDRTLHENRAAILKNNIIRLEAESPDDIIVLAIDTDIGQRQHAQIMKLYELIDELQKPQYQQANPMLKNLRVVRASGARLVNEIEKHTNKFDHVFVVGKDSNYRSGAFSKLQGVSWMSLIDDGRDDMFDYMPLFEAATLSIMAALKADKDSIKALYDAIANKPLTDEELAKFLNNRIFEIVPKAAPFDPDALRKIYETVRDVYLAA